MIETHDIEEITEVLTPSQHTEKHLEQPQQSESKLKIKECEICHVNEDLWRCSRCKKVYYCGKGCQTAGWAKHKEFCKRDEVGKVKTGEEEKKNKKVKEDELDEFGELTYVGTGNFSVIYKAQSKKDKQMYAIKEIEKNKLKRMRKEADVMMEKHCLNKLKDCDYVVNLYNTFEDELNLYFIMEFPPNGEIWEKGNFFGIIPNSIYKYYLSHIVKSVSILHNKYNIVHRDLKPENILLDDKNRIKLIDFGTAKDLDRPDIRGAGNGLNPKNKFEDYVGTPHYMAPECMHNKASSKKSDIYSLAGIFYFFKVGSPPFQGKSEYFIYNKSEYTNLLTCPELFEPELQDLLKKMNSKEMETRIDINEVMSHPYFAETDFENLGTYEDSLKNVSSEEQYIQDLTQNFIQIMDIETEFTLEERKSIYEKQILPVISQELLKNLKNENLCKKLKVIDVQCQSYLNIRDDEDISFSEIYYEVIDDSLKVKFPEPLD